MSRCNTSEIVVCLKHMPFLGWVSTTSFEYLKVPCRHREYLVISRILLSCYNANHESIVCRNRELMQVNHQSVLQRSRILVINAIFLSCYKINLDSIVCTNRVLIQYCCHVTRSIMKVSCKGRELMRCYCRVTRSIITYQWSIPTGCQSCLKC